MALGDAVPVVVVEDVREHAVGPGRAGGRQAPAVEQRGRAIAGVHLGRVVGGDQRRGRGAAGLADGDVVEQRERDVAPDGTRHGLPAELAGEAEDLLADGGCRGAHEAARRGLPDRVAPSSCAAATSAAPDLVQPLAEAELGRGDVERRDDAAGAVAHRHRGRDEPELELLVGDRVAALARDVDAPGELLDVAGGVRPEAAELRVAEEAVERRPVVVEQQRLAHRRAVRRRHAADPADRLHRVRRRLGQDRQRVGALQTERNARSSKSSTSRRSTGRASSSRRRSPARLASA